MKHRNNEIVTEFFATPDILFLDEDKSYYLAGPMSGYPGFNFEAFEKAVEILSNEGIKVKSPHAIDYGETEATRGRLDYETYMKAGLDLLKNECHGIILLAGWPRSTGAMRELTLAVELGLPVYYFHYHEKAGYAALVGMSREIPL